MENSSSSEDERKPTVGMIRKPVYQDQQQQKKKQKIVSKSPNPLRMEVFHQVIIKLDGMEEYLVNKEKEARMAFREKKFMFWEKELERLKLCYELYEKKKNQTKADHFLGMYEEFLVRGPQLDEEDEGYIEGRLNLPEYHKTSSFLHELSL